MFKYDPTTDIIDQPLTARLGRQIHTLQAEWTPEANGGPGGPRWLRAFRRILGQPV